MHLLSSDIGVSARTPGRRTESLPNRSAPGAGSLTPPKEPSSVRMVVRAFFNVGFSYSDAG